MKIQDLPVESQQLLRELNNRPEWQSILDAINEGKFPRYKPHGEDPKESQFYNWVFYSGKLEKATQVIKLLSGVKE